MTLWQDKTIAIDLNAVRNSDGVFLCANNTAVALDCGVTAVFGVGGGMFLFEIVLSTYIMSIE